MKSTKKKKSQARKTSQVPTKIYTYGAQGISEQDKLQINDQLWLAFRYYNDLIKNENDRRASFRQICCDQNPELALLDATVKSIQIEIDSKYTELRSLKDPKNPNYALPREQRENDPNAQLIISEIKALKKEKAEVSGNFGEICRVLLEELKPFSKAFDNVRYHLIEEHYLAEGKLIDRHVCDTDCVAAIKESIKKNELRIGPNVVSKYNKLAKQSMRGDKVGFAVSVAELEDFHYENFKKLRGNCGCFSGTYLKVEAAFNAAKKDKPSGALDFKIWKKGGLVAIQVSGKNSIQDILNGSNSSLSIEVGEKTMRQGKKFAVVNMCIGGVGSNSAKLSLPIVLHRPMPVDAIVKWAAVCAIPIGTRIKYEVQFTIESKEFIRPEPKADKAIAFNFGWRSLSTGNIRVAVCYDGESFKEILLPIDIFDDEKYGRSLLSIADQVFDQAIASVSDWAKTVKELPFSGYTRALMARKPKKFSDVADDYVPQTLEERLAKIGRMRSHSKLQEITNLLVGIFAADVADSAWNDWKQERLNKSAKMDLFDSFENISRWLDSKWVFDTNKKMAIFLFFWKKKDDHLVNWGRNVLKRVENRRKDFYRKTAKQFGNEYATVVFDDVNLSKLAEKPRTENDTRSPQEVNASKIRQSCGVSVLRDSLSSFFGSQYVVKVKSENISRQHLGCGEKFATSEQLMKDIAVECPSCHELYDQDVNAAKQIYLRATG